MSVAQSLATFIEQNGIQDGEAIAEEEESLEPSVSSDRGSVRGRQRLRTSRTSLYAPDDVDDLIKGLSGWESEDGGDTAQVSFQEKGEVVLEDEKCRELCDAIRKCTWANAYVWSRTRLGTYVGEMFVSQWPHVVEAVCSNRSVTSLRLTGCGLDEVAAGSLARSLGARHRHAGRTRHLMPARM